MGHCWCVFLLLWYFCRFGTVWCCARRERTRTKGKHTNNVPSNAGLSEGLTRQHCDGGDADGGNGYNSRGIGGQPCGFGRHGCKSTYRNQETDRSYQCSEEKGRIGHRWRAEHKGQQLPQLQAFHSSRTFSAAPPQCIFLWPKKEKKIEWVGQKSLWRKMASCLMIYDMWGRLKQ